jgi:hypothetical protein
LPFFRNANSVASFLALRLEVDLHRKMEEKGIGAPWPDLMRDLNEFRAVRMDLEGVPYLIRTDLEGYADDAFGSAGVRVPPRVMRLGESGVVP